jgi:hypothetical protein
MGDPAGSRRLAQAPSTIKGFIAAVKTPPVTLAGDQAAERP